MNKPNRILFHLYYIVAICCLTIFLHLNTITTMQNENHSLSPKKYIKSTGNTHPHILRPRKHSAYRQPVLKLNLCVTVQNAQCLFTGVTSSSWKLFCISKLVTVINEIQKVSDKQHMKCLKAKTWYELNELQKLARA